MLVRIYPSDKYILLAYLRLRPLVLSVCFGCVYVFVL